MPDRASPTADSGSADEAYVERVYRESAGDLVIAAYALTGDLTEAEDVVQEAFVRAFARPAKLVRADNPGAWMRVGTLNLARSRFRRRQRFDQLLRRLPARETGCPAWNRTGSRWSTPSAACPGNSERRSRFITSLTYRSLTSPFRCGSRRTS